MSLADPANTGECNCVNCTNPTIDSEYCQTCQLAGCDKNIEPQCYDTEPSL